MLRICARHIRRGIFPGNHLAARQACSPMPSHFSISLPCLSSRDHRDFALPNASWSPNLQDLYHKFEELTKNGDWKRLHSYDRHVHHMKELPACKDDPVEDRSASRLYTRNLDQDGVGFEYCMFFNKAEKRMVCLFQPGPYLEGPTGLTHGGCIATIIDTTAGSGIVYTFGPAFTANLNIDFRNPVPLGSTVIVDSKVEKIENRKIYFRCHIRSHDDKVLHAEATGLFIKASL